MLVGTAEYIRTTNSSRSFVMHGGISGEGVDNDWNATVNLGFSCHTDQAVVLECLKNGISVYFLRIMNSLHP